MSRANTTGNHSTLQGRDRLRQRRSHLPVRAYRAWVTRLERHGVTDGPLFRRVDRHGRLLGPLSAEAVAIVVKRHMGRLGYTAADLAGHSLRRGMATTAARNGASERTIMRTTGHTSTATVRGYIEDESCSLTPPPATSDCKRAACFT